jgi:hypothetical protein
MKTMLCLILHFLSLMNLTIDKDEFYSTLSGQDIQDINKLIVELEQQEPSTINNAYRGALLTKKAAFEVNAVKKINTFKTGVQLLETEIENFPNQTEYRFLRLSIQEHCPDILNYNKNIAEDVQVITNNFSKQSEKLKKIISNYAKKSSTLKSALIK